MSEEKLIENNLKSFGEELFRNIIINSARKAMLDNIEALSKKDLQKELKEHLQKEFELEDKTKKYKEVLDKIKENNQLIIDLGFDYDGFNNVDDLKGLIDELVDRAVKNKELLEEIE